MPEKVISQRGDSFCNIEDAAEFLPETLVLSLAQLLTHQHHVGRAEEHLRLWRDGDQLQDHVSHAATRLLMALTLRELA